ncbi:glutathione S-transferase family protein [Cylindrospermopsis raciborskii]|uniref:glutathione S-transferase family protein n=1 Tax=Cylindrospermopsis raciborskii TaxID=77022 RepID=UPI000778B093|nr:glutathione S-transferase family protein [Cylindrospermopsis raciborskii]MCZ2201302.1 glutathione S-transferase family protein [Cylindrospermopsis raciborskii PAMP2012]MCZ2206223.1 glutathione S-transferase family protein [Cylindrospermopsis raciborskii PAMP2011]
MSPVTIPSSTIPDWEELLETAQKYTSARRIKRWGQNPSSAPIPAGWNKLPPDGQPPILLYRDSNSWCPFCERVWLALEEKQIPFSTEFIDLTNKPKWYTDLVPTTLVPAAKIEGRLVYESKDILLAIEEHFDETLLPEDPQENQVARQWVEKAETNELQTVAYKLLRQPPEDKNELAKLELELESKLDEFEEDLGQYPGPYFLSTFSLVDIMYIPHLDRLAANLPVYRDYALLGNPRFPRINFWFAAFKERPAFSRVKSDPITNNLLLKRRFGLKPIGSPLPLNLAESELLEYRAEASERLANNRDAAIKDIVKNSGLELLGDVVSIRESVEYYLRLLADYLVNGDNKLLLGGNAGGKEGVDPNFAAVGAITLAYLRNRICAPRDMSSGAATALRAGVDRVLAAIY